MMMPNADAIALGKQIKAVRKAMKMTQEQLALKSNVSVKYIANIENGKQNPSFDILSSILHVRFSGYAFTTLCTMHTYRWQRTVEY